MTSPSEPEFSDGDNRPDPATLGSALEKIAAVELTLAERQALAHALARPDGDEVAGFLDPAEFGLDPVNFGVDPMVFGIDPLLFAAQPSDRKAAVAAILAEVDRAEPMALSLSASALQAAAGPPRTVLVLLA